jgi:hypothetical protein
LDKHVFAVGEPDFLAHASQQASNNEGMISTRPTSIKSSLVLEGVNPQQVVKLPKEDVVLKV